MINTVVVEEEEEEEEEVVGNSKDLMRFLGMKDGVTASMASQGTLSDDCVRLSVNNPMAQVQKSSEPVTTQVNFCVICRYSRDAGTGEPRGSP